MMKGFSKILVAGGAGFIGSHLVEHLSAHNEVTVFDDLSTGSLRNLQGAREAVRLHRASILQPKQLAKALEGHELVYHLAAKTSVPESVERQLRGDLDWITMKAMEKDRTRRYPSALDLAEVITNHRILLVNLEAYRPLRLDDVRLLGIPAS